ncbi:MAG: hypothetical protein P8188_07735, partial [Gemmatimonadota bacterium]
MADFGSRRGVTNLGVPLMLLTFLLIGGFMYWLYVTAEPTEPVVVEEVAEDEPAMDDSGAVEADPQDLKTGADAFTGSSVRLVGLTVSQMVGDEAFFVDLPANDTLPAQPFLVRMTPDLSATGASVAPGDRVTVVGGLMEMSDSIVSDWVS